MININRHNYEEIFIDYIDGNLDFHDVAELMLFLSKNPELDAELKGIEEVSINKKTTPLPIKALLKKEENTISGSAIYDRCIAKLEGDLSPEELKLFNSELLLNNQLKNNLLLVLKTKLKKDDTILYPFKAELKKQKTRKLYTKEFYRYAAMFIPAIIISFLYLNYNNNQHNSINNSSFTASNSVNKNIVKQKNKKTKVVDFKIIKTETPNIVSNSIHIAEKNNTEQEYDKLKTAKVKISNKEVFIDPVNKFINERQKFAELSKESIIENTKENKEYHVYIDPYNFTSNEIKSNELIHKSMEKLKIDDEAINKEETSKRFVENLAESFSNITSVFQFNKQKVDDGEVYRLAFNSEKFEIGRIKKKKD